MRAAQCSGRQSSSDSDTQISLGRRSLWPSVTSIRVRVIRQSWLLASLRCANQRRLNGGQCVRPRWRHWAPLRVASGQWPCGPVWERMAERSGSGSGTNSERERGRSGPPLGPLAWPAAPPPRIRRTAASLLTLCYVCRIIAIRVRVIRRSPAALRCQPARLNGGQCVRPRCGTVAAAGGVQWSVSLCVGHWERLAE